MEPARLLEMFSEAPVPRWMGATLTFEADGSGVVTLPARAEFIQATGVVHASVITFAGDSSAFFTAATAVKEFVVTSSFQLNLLRPVPAGSGLRATSVLVKCGKTLVVVRAQVFSDTNTLAAEGIWTHVVIPVPERSMDRRRSDL